MQADELELTFRPDSSVWDGRYANVAWLQELPKPLTKLTWDNAALIAPALAEQLGVSNGRKVELRGPTGTLTLPVWIVPGQAERTVTVEFGQGRRDVGRVADGAGVNVNSLRRSDRPWRVEGIALSALDDEAKLADTQMHGSMEGHDLVRTVAPGGGAKPAEPEKASLYDTDFAYKNRRAPVPAWAMAIDLDACIGCNACVTACVAENNILMVGRDQVRMGREMHWMRLDRYFEGGVDDPRIHFQPVPCMHCEDAPCEVGCPVRATVHGPEGLNQMIYNRCIGTRTCSSYCPYKVRRFNWYDYSQPRGSGIEALRNPDVTVRSRGVMEKCTYCVQRISAARRAAKKEDRAIRDGEVVTACQAACPTRAITFGDMNDPGSAIARAKQDPRDYTLLEELNVRPRTSYAARVRDEEPEDGSAG
jgi:molybdopterin-containing oxidoreductase family iron-sulfur binding subunit